MSEKKEKNSVFDKLANVQNLVVFIILIASGVANWMINNYRIDSIDQKIEKIESNHNNDIEKIDNRLSSVEKINFELLEEQLKELETTNMAIKKQVEKTNERMDNIYEILLNK